MYHKSSKPFWLLIINFWNLVWGIRGCHQHEIDSRGFCFRISWSKQMYLDKKTCCILPLSAAPCIYPIEDGSMGKKILKKGFIRDAAMTKVFWPNSFLFLVKLQNASNSNFTMIRWFWCLVFLFKWKWWQLSISIELTSTSELLQILVTSLDFFYILNFHWISNTTDLYVISPTVMFTLGLTFFKFYNPCFLIHSAKRLATQIFTWRHQVFW